LRAGRRVLAWFVREDGAASGNAANVLLEIAAAEQALGKLDAARAAAAARAWQIMAPVRTRDPTIRRLRANALGRFA